jgi:hypothetical protein
MHVEIYIKLKPTEHRITYLLYIFYMQRQSFVVKSAKILTILFAFAENKSCSHGSHDVRKVSLRSVLI